MIKIDSLLNELEERNKKLKKVREKLTEVKEKEQEIQKEIKKKDEINESNDCSIQCNIIEKRIDEEKRTVTAGILEGDTLSANKRFYPLSVVEAIKDSLTGKKALIGHDTDSPEDVVATITGSSMSGKRLIGSFKFGTDERSEMMFKKIKDGLVDSVSIRASGETKPGKINNETVEIVQNLNIWSVDFVVEGGVESAKVLQVFENAPKIEEVNMPDDKDMAGFNACMKDGGKMSMKDGRRMCTDAMGKDHMGPMMSKEEQVTYEKELTMNEELKKEVDELKKEKAALEAKQKKTELDAYKAEKLSTIEDKDIRADVAENLSGDSKEAIDASFVKLKKLAEGVAKKAGTSIKIEPINNDNKNESEIKNLNDLFESKTVEKKEKVEVLKALMDGKA